jgi:hypothetical protein
MRRAFAHAVAPHRRAIELPLVAEGRVEALPPDAHGVHEHLRRTALIPMLAEHGDRTVQGSIRIEFSRSCHKPCIALLERSFKYGGSVLLSAQFAGGSGR